MTKNDKFFRTRQLLLEKYNVQCGDDVLPAIRALVSRDEAEFIDKLVHNESFQAVSEVLKMAEERLRSPILVSVLQSNRIFLNLMKRQGTEYPATYELHRKLADAYPLAPVSLKPKDQGILDVGIRGKVVTRFPPEPSGHLHIGHAKAALLNNHYAVENGGTLIVRFDDTNPSKERSEFEDAILSDLRVLGIEKFVLSHTSDYFDRIIELGRTLIKEGKAYCDNTERDQMRVERDEGVESECRRISAEDNLLIFDEMVRGGMREYCVRAKIDMKSSNKAMRDPVIFRSNDECHYRVGNRYKIYPTYDFACPVVDCLEGVTHTLRTNEFRDRNAQYRWFVESLRLGGVPRIVDFARLNFEDTVLSKRKLKYFVEHKGIAWDDPRMPTIRGIRRRGLRMDALREYVLMQGVAQKFSIASWDKLWAINKRKIDADAPRYLCVRSADCVRTKIRGHVPVWGVVPRFARNVSLGEKKLFYGDEILLEQEDALCLGEGTEFRLLHWSNAVVLSRRTDGGAVKEMEVVLRPEGDVRCTEHRVHWVSLLGSVSVALVEYGNLTTGNSEDLDELFNKHSKTSEECFAESAVAVVEEGTILQFERRGFYYVDRGFCFNLVPFTKQPRRRCAIADAHALNACFK
eukprot:jgi/Antlo1/1836/1902